MLIDGLIIIVVFLVILTVTYLVKNVVVCKLKETFAMITEGYTNTPDKYTVKTYNLMDTMTYTDIGTEKSIGAAKITALKDFPTITLTNGMSLGKFDLGKVEYFDKDITMHFLAKLPASPAAVLPFLTLYTSSLTDTTPTEVSFNKATDDKVTYKTVSSGITILGTAADREFTDTLIPSWNSYKIIFDNDTGKLIVEIAAMDRSTSALKIIVFEDPNVKKITGFKFASIAGTTVELTTLQIWNKKFL